ncbi:MAG: ABC transporter substrate-binding protein, partial [Planctomycetes bacterium]|nr:ABC transporter substrate-binding protein [Planctomycetota bacterium]
MKSYLKNSLCFLGLMTALIGVIAIISKYSQKGAALPPETPPARIVSLSPAITEILFAIGLDREISGMTEECDFPAEKTGNRPRIGSVENPDIEAILKLKPDLIIAVKNTNGIVNKLIAREQNIIVVETDSIKKMLGGIKLIGEKTVKVDEAQRLIDSIQSALDEAQKNKKAQLTGGKSIMIVVAADPLKMATDKSFEGCLLKCFGAVNAITHQNAKYLYSNMPALIARNPGILIDATLSGDITPEKEKAQKEF